MIAAGRAFRELYGNWSLTTWAAQAAIAAAGGYTWNNLNCMLTKESGFGGSPVDLNPCGLAKRVDCPPHLCTSVQGSCSRVAHGVDTVLSLHHAPHCVPRAVRVEGRAWYSSAYPTP